MHSRRTFLQASGSLMASSAMLAPGLAMGQNAPAADAAATKGKVVVHELPPLPYAYDALEPFIDKETLTTHHDKHHAAYVKGLNDAEVALAKARAAGDYQLIQHWSRQYAFHGGGHTLHTLYWTIMAPQGAGGGGQPEGALADKIKEDFGDFEAFKSQMSTAAKMVEASGWCGLHYRPEDDRLLILQVENHQKLTPWYAPPILIIDVWEHAYYLKYRNARDAYIANWWNVVNWPQVAKNYETRRAMRPQA